MKPPRRNPPPRARINSYLPAPLRQRLAAHCATRGIYECEALKVAVTAYLDGTSDMTLLYRRLDAIQRHQQRQQRTLELHGELLHDFVQLFIEIAAGRIDRERTPEVLRKAERTYQAMIERVTARLSGGRTWVDDLPKDNLSPTLAAENEAAPEASGARQNGK